MKVEIVLNELIIEGMAVQEAVALQDAIESELSRLFAQHGLPRTLAQARMQPPTAENGGGAFSIHVDGAQWRGATSENATGRSAQAVGAVVAGSIYRGLRQ
jgi:hypothetical protein